MPSILQLRRGTSTEHSSFTGRVGEVTVNTTNDSLHVHDFTQAGGYELCRADLNNVSSTALNTAINTQVDTLLTAGTGITLNYDSGAGTLTITSSGGTGGYGDSDVQTFLSGGTLAGNIIPDQDNVRTLGSPTKAWADVYVGPGSLYVNGQQVITDDSGTINFMADANQNLSVQTSGSGDIEIEATGTGIVQLKSTVQLQAGSNITSSDGNAVEFGNAIDVDAIESRSTDTNLTLTGNGTGNVTVNDDLTITGNLTVSGTTTTVNTATLSVADNIVDLNSDFTTGTPSQNAGLRVLRGDETAVQLRWNEASDVWEITTDGSTYNTVAVLNSPTFTGTPQAPTASEGDDSTQIATTAYVDRAIATLAASQYAGG